MLVAAHSTARNGACRHLAKTPEASAWQGIPRRKEPNLFSRSLETSLVGGTMGRYKPGMRSKLIDIFFRRMQRRDTSGPVFVALGDRIAELDNLYHIALTKPDWRPTRIKPDPVEAVIPEE